MKRSPASNLRWPKELTAALERYERVRFAAPKMLAALMLYDERMRAYWGDVNALPSEMEDAKHVWPVIKEAIKEATGES